MIASSPHRILVKDQKDKIVGIISPKDLMRTIRGEENPAQDIRKKNFQTEAALRESVKRLESMERRLNVYEKAFQEDAISRVQLRSLLKWESFTFGKS